MIFKTISPAQFVELLKEADLAKLNGAIVNPSMNLRGELVLTTFAGDKTIVGQSVKLDLWYSDTTSYVKTIFGDIYLYRFTGLPVEKILK